MSKFTKKPRIAITPKDFAMLVANCGGSYKVALMVGVSRSTIQRWKKTGVPIGALNRS